MDRTGSSEQPQSLERLVSSIWELGTLEAQPAWGRASARYEHMGAKLADAVLQTGVGYEAFVRARVERIAADCPSGQTTSGFLVLLRSEGPGKMLNLKSGRKLRTILELSQCLIDHGVETTLDLRAWLQVPGNPRILLSVFGVGPKTVSFLKLLVGLDAVAVDIHVMRFVKQAGVTSMDPEVIEALLTQAGQQLALSGAQVDELVWRSMAARGRRVSRPS